jgi:hypothetical protein
LGWILFRSQYGFELTDESFYVLWISNPWIYEFSGTQFGFVYHPLYRLVGSDIVLLRQANALLTFGLAFWLGLALFGRLLRDDSAITTVSPNKRSVIRAGLAIALSSVSILIYSPWLPTPNYNSLVLQAIILAGIGIILAEVQPSRRSIVGWCLLGVAGWLSFMAKPTSAVALALFVGAYILASRRALKWYLPLLCAVTAVTLLALSAWAIDGSILRFGRRLLDASDLYSSVTEGRTFWHMFRLRGYGLNKGDMVFYALFILIVIASLLLISWRYSIRLIWIFLLILSIISISIIIEGPYFLRVYSALTKGRISFQTFGSRMIFAIPLGALLACVLLRRFKIVKFLATSRAALSLFLFFFLAPYIYALGTTNPFWFTGPMAGIFWVVAALILAAWILPAQSSWLRFLPILVVAQLIAVAQTSVSMEYPYRQPQPLRLSQSTVLVGEGNRPLSVSREFHDYISSLRSLAQLSGFTKGDPMIDLTGYSPGATVILGGKAIGQPWLIGGYRGSQRLAQVSLDRVPCNEMSRAWILTQPPTVNRRDPQCPWDICGRGLPWEIMSRYGANLMQDYASAGAVLAPRQPPQRTLEQTLQRPLRSREEGTSACERSRTSAADDPKQQ